MGSSLLGLLGLLFWQGAAAPLAVDILDPEGNRILVPVRVRVEAIADVEPPSLDRQWTQRQPFQAATSGPLGETLSVAGRAYFFLDTQQAWRFTCANEARWCAPTQHTVSGPLAPIPLTAWPKLAVHGRLHAQSSGALPSHLLIQGWATSKDGTTQLDLEIRADIAADGRFTFEAPALPLDLRLTAGEPWGPIYRWDQRASSSVLDLGNLDLVEGATLTTYLLDGSTGEAVEGGSVRWLPAMNDPDNHRAMVRRNLFHRLAVSDARGFIQLQGLAAGTYHLRAEAPGLGEVELGPFQIEEGTELHLAEVLLQPMARLRIKVTPTVDPDDRPWRLSIEHNNSNPRFSGYDTLTEDGVAELQIPRRPYRIAVQDSVHQHTVARRLIDLTTDSNLEIHARLIGVEGLVTLGDEPLPAEIRIDGGPFSQKVFKSDDKGHFQGWMGWRSTASELETFTIFIRPETRANDLRRTVDADLRDGTLHIELHLPDRTLRGQVVDAKGRPVEGVSVRANIPGHRSRSTTLTNESGHFDLWGIPEGHPIRLVATLEDRGSAHRDLVNWGTGAGPETTLVLNALRPIHGIVQTSDGTPLPGAKILILSTHFSNVTSHLDGTFEGQVSDQDRRGKVNIEAPGFPFWSTCMPFPERGPITVRLSTPGPGGRLHLDLEEFQQPQEGGDLYVLTPDGGFTNLTSLHQWAITLEGATHQDYEHMRLSFPNLSPGLYSVVWFDQQQSTLEVLCDRLLTPLTNPVMVPQGGEATLKIVN